MDTVKVKYENFKKFVTETAPKDNEHVKLLNEVSIGVFLEKIRQFKDRSENDIVQDVLNIIKMDKSQFNPDDINKFLRYIQYFRSVVIAMN